MGAKITKREADRLHRAITRLSAAAFSAGVADANEDEQAELDRADARHRVAVRMARSAVDALRESEL